MNKPVQACCGLFLALVIMSVLGCEEVTTDEMMAKSKIIDSTWVKQIVDRNNAVYGYLIHRAADRTSVAIIDENTAKLYYHYIRTSGGR